MAGSGGLVLVLNSGSSSVKSALVHPETGERLLGGLADKVGTPQAVLQIRRDAGEAVEEPLPDGSYHEVISRILDHLDDAGHADLTGAGHRVVHGGDRAHPSLPGPRTRLLPDPARRFLASARLLPARPAVARPGSWPAHPPRRTVCLWCAIGC